jgi:hypothetical protein
MEKSPDGVPSPMVTADDDKKVDSIIAAEPGADLETGHIGDLKGANIKGVDKAFEYANSEAVSIDEKTNKYLLRKIDWNILPWLCGLYVLQYLDKGV